MTTGQLGIAVSGGVQTAIHAIRAAVARGKASLLHRGLALLDYKNAFNRANRSAAMRVVMNLVPEFAAYIDSLYGDSSNGYLYGYSALSIEEGSIQGETFGSILFALLNHQLNLDFLASTGHSDVGSADIVNVSIIDDVTFEAPIQTVVDYVAFVVSNGPGYGMELSASKTLILANNAESAAAFSHLLAGRGCAGTIQSDNIRSLDSISGFTCLGAGFSCQDSDFADNFVNRKLCGPKATRLFARLAQLEDGQVAFRLLHAALAFPKEVFYASTHAPGSLPTALRNHHELVLSALQDRLPVGSKLDGAASLIARLPFRRGGLALRSAHELRDCIYLASASAASLNFSTLPMFAPLHWSPDAARDIVASSLQNINAFVASLDRQLVPSDANTKAQVAQLSNWDGVARFSQKLLTRVFDVFTVTQLHSIISKLPDQIQADYADMLNSYAFPVDETAYTQHILSQLPVGANRVASRDWPFLLAMRLHIHSTTDPSFMDCPACRKRSDSMGHHASCCGSAVGFGPNAVPATTAARHAAFCGEVYLAAKAAGCNPVVMEDSLAGPEKRDGDVVMHGLIHAHIKGPVFVDCTVGSTVSSAQRPPPNIHLPFWLTLDSSNDDRLTFPLLLERIKLRDLGAANRVTQANSRRPADAKISYFVLASTQYGFIGSHGDELFEALAHQCRKNATRKRSTWAPYSSVNRLKGRLSSVIQRAQATAIRARVPQAE
jgi:hypothetical protein